MEEEEEAHPVGRHDAHPHGTHRQAGETDKEPTGYNIMDGEVLQGKIKQGQGMRTPGI